IDVHKIRFRGKLQESGLRSHIFRPGEFPFRENRQSGSSSCRVSHRDDAVSENFRKETDSAGAVRIQIVAESSRQKKRPDLLYAASSLSAEKLYARRNSRLRQLQFPHVLLTQKYLVREMPGFLHVSVL